MKTKGIAPCLTQILISRHPDGGYRIIEGVLIQRECVRQSLSRVDPAGLQRRLTRVLHRRQYHVPSPNALWYIDGNHK